MRATGISHFHAFPDVWSLFMMSGRVIWPASLPMESWALMFM